MSLMVLNLVLIGAAGGNNLLCVPRWRLLAVDMRSVLWIQVRPVYVHDGCRSAATLHRRAYFHLLIAAKIVGILIASVQWRTVVEKAVLLKLNLFSI